MPRPRALLVAPEAPYPLHGGGCFRTAAILHYLASRYTVDAILFRVEGAASPMNDLPSRLIDRYLLIDLPPHSRSFAARVFRNLSRAARAVPPLNDRFAGFESAMSDFARPHRYAHCIVEHLWCAPYQDTLNEFCDSMTLDLHNVESVLFQRRRESTRWPTSELHRSFSMACRALERRWLPRYNRVLVPSSRDASAARELAYDARIEVYPNTIPARPAPSAARRPWIAFSANFDYDPNQTAVAWLLRSVWPRLLDRHPHLELRLVGRNPDAVRKHTAGVPRVHCTGPIENAAAELEQAMVAVAPIRSGSGTRIKILEAWAAGLPVVSTPVGAEGLPGRDGVEWLIREDAAEFTEAVSSLVGTASMRERMGAAGRALYESEFTWEAGWKVLDRLGFDYTG